MSSLTSAHYSFPYIWYIIYDSIWLGYDVGNRSKCDYSRRMELPTDGNQCNHLQWAARFTSCQDVDCLSMCLTISNHILTYLVTRSWWDLVWAGGNIATFRFYKRCWCFADHDLNCNCQSKLWLPWSDPLPQILYNGHHRDWLKSHINYANRSVSLATR